MPYKTIIVHVDDSAPAASRIETAAHLALQEQAHLIGAATTGVAQVLYQGMAVDVGNNYITGFIDALRQRAQDALRTFEVSVGKLGVPSFESRLIDEETAGGICLHARYSDLVIVGQTEPDTPPVVVGKDFPEFVTMYSGCPVLVIPYAGKFDRFPQKAIVAWDGGLEATRALHDALPLLQHARTVEIAVINPNDRPGVHGPEPGADVALYLARHGLKVEVRVSKVPHAEIGTSLLSHLADINADLLVMGCYGHSRLREILLGGVTRSILSSMTVPVLMSH